MKESLEKAKLTNIAFEPVYGVSCMEEYYELQSEGKLHRPWEELFGNLDKHNHFNINDAYWYYIVKSMVLYYA